MNLLERFQNIAEAGREFRPVPFWSWNDTLETREVREQIREMKRAGFGGAFLHARLGLVTSYMGKDWMESVLAACDEARETGLLPWLYDEDCWPSGYCGRRVTQGRPDAQAKALLHEIVRPMQFRPAANSVAVFLAEKNSAGRYVRFNRVPDLQAARAVKPKPAEVMLHFYYDANEYVDVLNRNATGAFLESTHEEYRRITGRFFGTAIPGIFTDEPQYRGAPPGLAWSLELPEFFRRAAGYDLLDHLPALFFPVPAGERVRFDYHHAVLRLFLLAWTLPISQWCTRNHLQLTGHLMGEDTLASQIQFVGAAMPHYEYMHIPGIDHLGRVIRSPVLPKQVSSAANQFGRRRVLSEMWAGAGQNASFEELRWIADWQIVFGVNLVCPHLALYSMRGCRKRDYPPNLFFQQPWWRHMRLLSDTIARTTALTTQGELVADVLVLHPVTSAWVLNAAPLRDQITKLDHDLAHLAAELSGLHCDWEFGDEMIMERHAKLLKKQIQIGQRKYSAVVVPSSVNWKSSTLELLRRFVRAGGRLIFTGRLPNLIDGEPSKDLEKFVHQSKRLDARSRAGLAQLRKFLKPKLEILVGRGKGDARSVAAMWRNCGREQLFFLVNLDPEAAHDLDVTLPVKGAVSQLDAATGAVAPLGGRAAGAGQKVKLHLPRMASTILLVDTKTARLKAQPARPRPRRVKVLARRWDYRRMEPNALLLESARPTLGEEVIDKYLPIADINKMLLVRGQDTVVELAFEFHAQLDQSRTRRLQLAVEIPTDYEIHLNGLRVPLREEGWWLDKSLRLLDISRLVSRGRNELKLRRPWSIRADHRDRLLGLVPGAVNHWVYPQVELEPVFLVGDFAVSFDGAEEAAPAGLPAKQLDAALGLCQPAGRSLWLCGKSTLVPETTSGAGQDLLRAGLPFFAGTVELTQTLVLAGNPSPHAVLEFSRPDALLTQAVINGHALAPLWQEPYRLEVGKHLVKGKNDIKLRLTNSLRNLLGPHHNAAGDSYFVSPSSFEGTLRIQRGHLVDHADFRPDYNLVPFGLAGDVTLYY